MSTYIAIDLKSFYASVECVERGLDPLTTNLVVADETRTDKTICLAVSPSLKALGVGGRERLFEVKERVREINAERKANAPNHKLVCESHNAPEIFENPNLAIGFIIAKPRMKLYLETSARVYKTYLKYAAPEDIHVYSIDEVFIDATNYLSLKKMSARDFAMMIILDVLKTTGITATAGIGTNLYLCKVAMDITAKHIPADENGVRIAELDEMSYREKMWAHTPITDFWRVGRGYARKLESLGLYTMGDVARFSLSESGEELLYKKFGINAELLIDHAWGLESCTMQDIKEYKSKTNSLSLGQVLKEPYSFDKARLIVREMAEALSLDLTQRHVKTRQLTITIGFDTSNITENYSGNVSVDHYGRRVPTHAHGTQNLFDYTSSSKEIMEGATVLFEKIADPSLLIRRINITACNVISEETAASSARQMSFFENAETLEHKKESEEKSLRIQQAQLEIKKKYGKNAIFRGMNLEEGATNLERNEQIGGHKA